MRNRNTCEFLAVFIITLLIATQISVNDASEIEADEEGELLQEYICLKKQKLTKIHFYVQDIAGGPNATVFEITRGVVPSDSLLAFGKILVVDDDITVAPGGDSEKLGKAQGILTSADKEVPAMAMNINIAFTSGKYNGSTLSVAGRNLALNRRRNLAVVGGTGVFRYTRGHAVVDIYSSLVGEDSAFYNVFEYTIYATFCQSM